MTICASSLNELASSPADYLGVNLNLLEIVNMANSNIEPEVSGFLSAARLFKLILG